MVEPVTAGVLSSLLPGRVYLKNKSISIARAIGASTKPTLAAHLFTPTPRTAKGKAKADCHVSDCQEWACSASRHSIWCQHGTRSLALGELEPRNLQSAGQRLKHRTSQSSRNRIRNFSRQLPSEIHGGQRRHVSQAMNASPLFFQPGTSYKHTILGDPAEAATRLSHLRTLLEPSNRHIMAPDSDQEGLEKAISAVEEMNVFATMSEEELVNLLRAVATKFQEKMYPPYRNTEQIHQWGKHLHDLIKYVPDPNPSTSTAPFAKQSLMTRSLAIMGRHDEMLESFSLHKLNTIDEDNDRAALAVVLSIAYHDNLLHALHYLLVQNEGQLHIKNFHLRNPVGNLIARTSGLPGLLRQAGKEGWSSRDLKRLVFHLLRSTSAHKLLDTSLAIISEARVQKLKINEKILLNISCRLAAAKKIPEAKELFGSVTPSSERHYIAAALYIAARQGHDFDAQNFMIHLEENGVAGTHDIANLMLSFAVQGRSQEVQRLFNDYFPRKPDGGRYNEPNAVHFNIAMYSAALKGDVKELNAWLDDMQDCSIQPDVHGFSNVLQTFAKVGDVKSVSATFTQMRRLGVQPNNVTYTILISLFADRHDPDSADAVYKLACQEGIIPDAQMIRALMDAHVEGGSWQGVIRTFDYLSALPAADESHITIEVYNILLKAYVLIGAPFRLVSKLFFKIQNQSLKPDTYTFALLIQSACDAGELRIASDIYHEILRREEAQESHKLISPHIMTILMSAFLRVGDKQQAKAVYDEMVEKGIQPTAITYGAIVKAYGRELNEESMRIAEDFVNKLVSTPGVEQHWNKPLGSGKTPLGHLYGPMLRSHALRKNVQEVERLYSEYLDRGGEPSIAMLTYVLEGYRRTADVEGALAVWPHIVELAEVVPIDSDAPDKLSPSWTAPINVPLSIYIDVLSCGGFHSELSEVWQELKKKGQRFDSHNWNHLAVALIRAGQLQRAFEVVEKVLLPYERLAQIKRQTDMERGSLPMSPFLAKKPSTDSADLELPRELPSHDTERRIDKMPHYGLRRHAAPELDQDDVLDDDDVHPLELLQKITPAWNVWRPHVAVMRSFLIAYLKLKKGFVIRPVRRGEVTQYSIAQMDMSERNPDHAKAILEKLEETCPQTISRIYQFQFDEQQKWSADAYDRMYSWR
ncbi:hypothetical protein B0H34DRAFT_793947 [Crassisporium funariophilum]|nr:hypothetical protein B0H34DRAFT_793947 [Crassisporium funariophilum]